MTNYLSSGSCLLICQPPHLSKGVTLSPSEHTAAHGQHSPRTQTRHRIRLSWNAPFTIRLLGWALSKPFLPCRTELVSPPPALFPLWGARSFRRDSTGNVQRLSVPTSPLNSPGNTPKRVPQEQGSSLVLGSSRREVPS